MYSFIIYREEIKMLSILCPCYNEEKTPLSFPREVTRVMEETPQKK